MSDTIGRARIPFGRVGRGCIVSLVDSEKSRYATVSELVPRLGALREAEMLLTAISEAVESYDPKREAVLVIESERATDVLILRENGSRAVGGSISSREGADSASTSTLPSRPGSAISFLVNEPLKAKGLQMRSFGSSFQRYRPFVLVTGIVMLVHLSGCSSYTPPAPRIIPEKESAVSAPIEDIWRGVIRYFGDLNIPIETLDHSSYFIKTRPVDLATSFSGATFSGTSISIRTGACDCGTATMANVWSSTTRIFLSFNIILEPKGDASTVIRVNTFFEGVKLGKRNLYASGYDQEIRLTCVSTGNFERDLIRFLESSARP